MRERDTDKDDFNHMQTFHSSQPEIRHKSHATQSTFAMTQKNKHIHTLCLSLSHIGHDYEPIILYHKASLNAHYKLGFNTYFQYISSALCPVLCVCVSVSMSLKLCQPNRTQ